MHTKMIKTPRKCSEIREQCSKMCSKVIQKFAKHVQFFSEIGDKGLISCGPQWLLLSDLNSALPYPLHHGALDNFNLEIVSFVFQEPTI
jgi:hypothetical protein